MWHSLPFALDKISNNMFTDYEAVGGRPKVKIVKKELKILFYGVS